MKYKKIVILATAGMLAFSITGCGGKKEESKTASSKVEQEEKKVQDLKTISDRLLKEIKYDDELSEMDKDMFDILYVGFPADKIKERYIFLSSTGGTAEEVACFEAVDEAAAEEIKKAAEARLEFQRASFNNYVPAEVKRIDKAVIQVEGNYVILSISAEPDKAKEIISGK